VLVDATSLNNLQSTHELVKCIQIMELFFSRTKFINESDRIFCSINVIETNFIIKLYIGYFQFIHALIRGMDRYEYVRNMDNLKIFSKQFYFECKLCDSNFHTAKNLCVHH